MRGFSLLEVLLVVAVLAIVGAAGVGSYLNAAKSIESTSTARTVIADIRLARAKAMGGQDDRRWGVHVVNGAADYYEIFSTPSNYADAATTVSDTVYLPAGISFSNPGESATRDIVFSTVFGTTTATTLVLASQTESHTITITALGVVY
jgi:prepilin-type N-terminal cleavage/methylation domain-containing protein